MTTFHSPTTGEVLWDSKDSIHYHEFRWALCRSLDSDRVETEGDDEGKKKRSPWRHQPKKAVLEYVLFGIHKSKASGWDRELSDSLQRGTELPIDVCDVSRRLDYLVQLITDYENAWKSNLAAEQTMLSQLPSPTKGEIR